MRKIKISKIVFFFSAMILCTVLFLYIASMVEEKEPVVSLREEYQTQLEQGNE